MQKEEILILYSEGKGYTEIVELLNIKGDREKAAERIRGIVRRAIKIGEVQKRNLKHKRKPEVAKEPVIGKEKEYFEMKVDGTVTQDRIIEIMEEDAKSPRALMIAHKLDPDYWEVIAYRNNFWHSQLKGGQKQVSGQSRITVKPKTSGLSFADVDDYFSNLKEPVALPKIIPTFYNEQGQTLEICLPDWHAGLLAWRGETGQDYDLHIAQERLRQCALDIVSRASNKVWKKIVLVTLGDLLHIDNDSQTTTKGTFQQADGRIAKIFDFTVDSIKDFILILGNLAPVEVIYLPGNHDRVTGYMSIHSVSMRFWNDSKVTFDIAPRSEKWRVFGRSLVGWHHGDAPASNMKNWLQHKARKEFGEAKYCEIHTGHYHSNSVKETNRDKNLEGEMSGVTIRSLPTIAPSSFWESQQEYSSVLKTLMAFVWHDEIGLREIWYSNIA